MRATQVLRLLRAAIPMTLLSLFLVSMTGSGRSSPVRAEFTKDGKSVVVLDARSGAVLHSLPKPAGLVRSVYALARGTVVVTTRGDGSEFWDTRTGAVTARLGDPVHGISHDGSRLVTFSSDHQLMIRSFPTLAVTRVLEAKSEWGPSAVAFSPDDRFVAVEFCNHYPLSDEQFLNPVFDATLYATNVYEVESGRRVPEASGARIGSFSPDARYYMGGSRSFDLRARRWTSAEGRP